MRRGGSRGRKRVGGVGIGRGTIVEGPVVRWVDRHGYYNWRCVGGAVEGRCGGGEVGVDVELSGGVAVAVLMVVVVIEIAVFLVVIRVGGRLQAGGTNRARGSIVFVVVVITAAADQGQSRILQANTGCS